MINPKRKIHSYNNPNKYRDETITMSTTLRLRGDNASGINKERVLVVMSNRSRGICGNELK